MVERLNNRFKQWRESPPATKSAPSITSRCSTLPPFCSGSEPAPCPDWLCLRGNGRSGCESRCRKEAEDLNPEVAFVGDVEQAIGTDGQVGWIQELTWLHPHAPDAANFGAVRREDINSMEAVVGDVESALSIDRRAPWFNEFGW